MLTFEKLYDPVDENNDPSDQAKPLCRATHAEDLLQADKVYTPALSDHAIQTPDDMGTTRYLLFPENAK
jgi:hypothetical protein